MPRIARTKSSLKVYHIMLRGVNKQNIFLDNQDRKMFIRVLLKSKEKFKYSIYSYVLMRNHVHLEIMDNDLISKIMHYICLSYAMYFNYKYNRVGHLFQDRYKSKPIENEEYLITVLRYIHQNPVKAKIDSIENYKWSSYRDYIEGCKNIVDIDYILNLINRDNKNSLEEFKKINRANIHLKAKDILELEMKSKLNDSELKEVIIDVIGENDYKNFNKYNNFEKKRIINKLKDIKEINMLQISNTLGINEAYIRRIYKEK